MGRKDCDPSGARPVAPTKANVLGFKRLARAVVYKAIEDLSFDPTPEEQAERIAAVKAEAREWLLSDVDEQGSFVRMCNVGGLKPAVIRRKLGYVQVP